MSQSLTLLVQLSDQASATTQLDANPLGLQEAQPDLLTHFLPDKSEAPYHFNRATSPSYYLPVPEHSGPTAPLSGPSLPLTRENLSQLNGDMSNPMTPENSESKSTTRNTKSSTSVKVGPVRELLRLKNMRFDDDRARGDAAAFVFGESIVNSRRDSPDRPQSDQGLAGLMRKYSQDNEATLMHKWFHPLVKDDRMPNERLAYQEAAVMDRDEDMERFEDAEESRQILDPNGVWRFFQADGLESSWDKEFHRGSIPKLDHPNKKDLAKLLEVLPRIVNPKPDITYGYDNNFFTDVQRALNLRLISTAKISSAINWPFLNVDAKLSDILAAVNQCNRSGSGVVCSVWRVCDEYDITIPDIDDVSTVFTLAITTGSAYIHVHWAELEHGVRVYHMKTVAGFALGMEKAHMDLRKAINSILDWGLLRRKPKIDQLLDAILAKEKEKKSGERGATAP